MGSVWICSLSPAPVQAANDLSQVRVVSSMRTRCCLVSLASGDTSHFTSHVMATAHQQGLCSTWSFRTWASGARGSVLSEMLSPVHVQAEPEAGGRERMSVVRLGLWATRPGPCWLALSPTAASPCEGLCAGGRRAHVWVGVGGGHRGLTGTHLFLLTK